VSEVRAVPGARPFPRDGDHCRRLRLMPKITAQPRPSSAVVCVYVRVCVCV